MFVALYFIVLVALAIGMFIVYRVRRDADFRIRWHARISLIVGLSIMTFMFLLSPSWVTLLFIGVFGGLIIYLDITKTTICRSCGRVIQGIALIHRAKHCPHCGGETVCSKILSA